MFCLNCVFADHANAFTCLYFLNTTTHQLFMQVTSGTQLWGGWLWICVNATWFSVTQAFMGLGVWGGGESQLQYSMDM